MQYAPLARFVNHVSANEKVRINEGIRAREVRVIDADGQNAGVMSSAEALEKAREAGLDLIEISPKAKPPVVRITDYGKFKYDQKKKARETKAKAHQAETKVTQIKIGTSERDQHLKASRVAAWLREGHRVKIDLFLWGRYKYMEPTFLKERLSNFLAIIPESFKIADDIKKSPKGFSVIIERDRTGKSQGTQTTAESADSDNQPPKDHVTENK